MLPIRIAVICSCVTFTASLAQPRAIVDPAGPIEEDLQPGERVLQFFEIFNDGDEPLRFIIEIEYINEPERDGPHRDEPGDIIARLQGINAANQHCSPVGFDRDNERMWVTNFQRSLAVAYSFNRGYERFEEEIRIDPGQCMDGCWARGLLYLPTWASQDVNRYDAERRNIGAWRSPAPVVGLAADEANGWLFTLGNDNHIRVYALGDDGSVGDQLGIIQAADHMRFHNNQIAYGLEWVHSHSGGQLWMTSAAQGRVYQIGVEAENWRCENLAQFFQVFAGADLPHSSVAHDGHNLWAGGFNAADIRIYDDGVTEFYWLTVEPMEGEIAPGESQEITVMIDTAGLIGGEYRADIHIYTNDPEAPEFVIEVIMYIWQPLWFFVEWPEAYGFPEVIDFNRARNNLYVGGEYFIPVTFWNGGSDDITVEAIEFDHDFFRAEPNRFVLEPNEDLDGRVFFRPEEAGLAQAVMSVVTDDPDLDVIEIPVAARALPPPQIVIDPQGIEDEIVGGGREVYGLNIANDGEGWPEGFRAIVNYAGGLPQGWLAVEPAEGEVPEEISVIVDFRRGFPAGDYQGEVEFRFLLPGLEDEVVNLALMIHLEADRDQLIDFQYWNIISFNIAPPLNF